MYFKRMYYFIGKKFHPNLEKAIGRKSTPEIVDPLRNVQIARERSRKIRVRQRCHERRS